MPSLTRVLVVDDETPIRDLLVDALGEAGFDVQAAANGAEALSVLQRWLPHVIVLDLMMPRLDGMGFAELLRLNPRIAHVPILLVTAAYDAQGAAEHIGARAWLAKPFELDQLIEAVVRLAARPDRPQTGDVRYASVSQSRTSSSTSDGSRRSTQ